jgi:DHA1 family tetracycline resistance protein-like MFS transporter
MWVLYTDYRYQWSARAIGLTLAVVGIFSAVVQGGLIRKGVARLGERNALMLGLFCGAAGFACYGLASAPALFFLGIPFGALWGFAGPSAQALMSQRVDPTEQGRLQGALAGLRGITGMIGPTLFTTVFAWSIGPRIQRPFPGAPFLLATALLAAAFLVAWIGVRAPVPAAAVEPD